MVLPVRQLVGIRKVVYARYREILEIHYVQVRQVVRLSRHLPESQERTRVVYITFVGVLVQIKRLRGVQFKGHHAVKAHLVRKCIRVLHRYPDQLRWIARVLLKFQLEVVPETQRRYKGVSLELAHQHVHYSEVLVNYIRR